MSNFIKFMTWLPKPHWSSSGNNKKTQIAYVTKTFFRHNPPEPGLFTGNTLLFCRQLSCRVQKRHSDSAALFELADSVHYRLSLINQLLFCKRIKRQMGLGVIEHLFGTGTGGRQFMFVIPQIAHDLETVHGTEVSDIGQSFGCQFCCQLLNIAADNFGIYTQQIQVVSSVGIRSIGFLNQNTFFFT